MPPAYICWRPCFANRRRAPARRTFFGIPGANTCSSQNRMNISARRLNSFAFGIIRSIHRQPCAAGADEPSSIVTDARPGTLQPLQPTAGDPGQQPLPGALVVERAAWSFALPTWWHRVDISRSDQQDHRFQSDQIDQTVSSIRIIDQDRPTGEFWDQYWNCCWPAGVFETPMTGRATYCISRPSDIWATDR